MLGRQGRPETLSYRPAVLLSYHPQHLPPELLAVRSVRPPPHTAVFQPRGSFLPVPLPQPLGLPVANAHQKCRVHHPQLPPLHAPQHLRPPQFPLTHRRSPHTDLLSEVELGDISNEEKRGHYHRGTTSASTVDSSDSSHSTVSFTRPWPVYPHRAGTWRIPRV